MDVIPRIADIPARSTVMPAHAHAVAPLENRQSLRYEPRPKPAAVRLVETSAAALAQAAFSKLTDWDLDLVKRYAVQEGIYAPDEIDEVADEYRKYMALAMTCDVDNLPISRKLDDLWHTHIVFTQDYAAMCQTVAGRFIHHRPHILDEAVTLARGFDHQTLRLYGEAFGEPNPRLWDVVLCKCCPGD